MAKDIFLVDAGVVALLALEWLLAFVVKHVLLQDTQAEKRDSRVTVPAEICSEVCSISLEGAP